MIRQPSKNQQFDDSGVSATERLRPESLFTSHRKSVGVKAQSIRLIAALSRTLAHTSDLADLMQSCVNLLQAHFEAAVAQIWLVSEDQRNLELRACAGLPSPPDRLGGVAVAEAEGIGQIARDGLPFCTNSFSEHSLLANQAGVNPDGMVAFAGYPLLASDRLLGFISLFFENPLCDGFVSSSGWLADTIALGVELKQAEAALQKIESQQHQTARLETLGRLVAGVAHDFNNLVTVITGYGQMVREAAEQNLRLLNDADELHKAAQRASALSRQLLAFSRQQPVQRGVLDLNSIVLDLAKMLRRLLPEDIELVTVLEPELGHIEADAGQIEQVLMNLAINARDAMSGGGKLVIESSNVELGARDADKITGLRAGPHVALTVSDTGCGIDADSLLHIFDEFYSTKEPGNGTGLGLTIVQQALQQNGGGIGVTSQPGRGTIFKVLLPRVEGPAQSSYLSEQRPISRPGTELTSITEEIEQRRAG